MSMTALLGLASRGDSTSSTVQAALQSYLPFRAHSTDSQLCDPTEGQGWVSEEGYWERADGACHSSQFVNRLRAVREDRYREEFPSLVNKTMFILGDSVGRHLYEQLCDEIKAPKEWRTPPVEPKVDYSEALVCVQPQLNLTIVQHHQYGFANASDPKTLGYLQKCFPGGPYDYQTRVPAVWANLLQDIPVPDIVQLSGGAWDFLYMYNRDILEKRYHHSIPEEDIQAFTGQLRGMFAFLRDYFPTSKLLWINVHPLNNVDLAVKHIWGGGYFQPTLDVTQDSPLLPPLFSQRRLAQHAQALRQVAVEEQVDSLDYWKLKDSFNAEEFWAPNDAVHPNTLPRVAMVEMMLEKLHRYSQYGL